MIGVEYPLVASPVYADGRVILVRDKVCVGVRIADEDHSSVGIDGRCNHAVLTVKWSERQLPSLFAREIVSDQAEIGEEDKDPLAIGHRGGRGAVIEGVLGFAPGSAD